MKMKTYNRKEIKKRGRIYGKRVFKLKDDDAVMEQIERAYLAGFDYALSWSVEHRADMKEKYQKEMIERQRRMLYESFRK